MRVDGLAKRKESGSDAPGSQSIRQKLVRYELTDHHIPVAGGKLPSQRGMNIRPRNAVLVAEVVQPQVFKNSGSLGLMSLG